MTRARKCRESRSNRCGNAEPTPYRIRGVAHAIHVTTANVTVRARALATFDRRRVALSQVQRALADGGLHREAFCRRGAKPVGSPGGSGGAVFHLAGEAPPTMEELRKQALCQSPVCKMAPALAMLVPDFTVQPLGLVNNLIQPERML